MRTGPSRCELRAPFDAETPVREFASWLTPNERFFVRSHFGPPAAESVQADTWRLAVKGLVKEGLSLSLKDLQQFESVTVTSVLQCSGNGPRIIAQRFLACNGSVVQSAMLSGPAYGSRRFWRAAGVKSQAGHVQFLGPTARLSPPCRCYAKHPAQEGHASGYSIGV